MPRDIAAAAPKSRRDAATLHAEMLPGPALASTKTILTLARSRALGDGVGARAKTSTVR